MVPHANNQSKLPFKTYDALFSRINNDWKWQNKSEFYNSIKKNQNELLNVDENVANLFLISNLKIQHTKGDNSSTSAIGHW